MSQKVRGVVAMAKDAPVTIETIVIPDPGPGEAVVDIKTCGVCHTDLHYQQGGIGDEYPYLLGHEATGVVSAIGEGVDHVKVGDTVILNWRAVCGECRACRKGEPKYCFNTHNATQKMTLEDGTELSPALGIGAFADKTLVHAKQCTQVDGVDTPEEQAAVGLLGCGIMAGIGAAIIGSSMSVAIGALTFILAFVPIVGALTAGVVAVGVVLVTLGFFKAVIMLIVFVAVMQIEGHVLQPFLLGKAVSIHPLIVLVGIAVGAIISGIVGALFAIPIVAFGVAFIKALSPETPAEEVPPSQDDLAAEHA